MLADHSQTAVITYNPLVEEAITTLPLSPPSKVIPVPTWRKMLVKVTRVSVDVVMV